ncbi:Secreted protein (fragment) [Listeria monocytogenes]
MFKDDPNLVYEYNYNSKRNTPYHINLLVFKDGSSQEDDQVKHPPLQEQND